MYHSIKDVRKIITEADGYQPHSIAPKQGYRGLIENSLVSMKGPAEAAVDAVYKAIRGSGTTLMVVKILGGVLCYADTKGTYYTDQQETLFEGGDGYSKVRFISNFSILAMIADDLLSGNIIIDEISQLFNRAPAINKEEMSCIDILKSRLRKLARNHVREVYKVICGSGTTLMVVNILGGVLCYADTKGTYYIDQQETLLEGGDGFSKVRFISNFPILAMIAGDLLSGNIIIDEITQLFNRAPAINKEEMSCIDVLKSRLRRLARNHARGPDPISATIILVDILT